ncbi:MAG: site-specific integrase [Deltaproteobacteria bacterium]
MAILKFNEERQRWIIRYYDHTGRRGWESLPKDTRKRDAQKRRREIEDQIENKVFKRPGEIPTFGHAAEQWLESKSATIRQTTHDQYQGHIENHLKPYLGEIKCSDVDLSLTEKFVTHMVEKGIYPNTIKKVLTTLSSIMAYASHPKRCYASYNPVKHVENAPGKITREADCATPEEINAIVEKMGQRDRLIVHTMAIGGLREGEVFGLQWGDVEWTDSQIHIRRTFNHGRFFEPKSARSKRAVDVPEDLLHELKKWRLACPNGELDLVFPNTDGGPIIASNWLKRSWHPAREDAGVRHLTPHSLRHFSGSYLIDRGEDLGYVQDHLGHSSIQITMDVYRHKLRKRNQRAANSLGSAFFKADGCKTGANEV